MVGYLPKFITNCKNKELEKNAKKEKDITVKEL